MAAAEGEKGMIIMPKVCSDAEEFEVEVEEEEVVAGGNGVPRRGRRIFGTGEEFECRSSDMLEGADAAAPGSKFSYTSDGDDASATVWVPSGGGLRNLDADIAKVDKATVPAERERATANPEAIPLEFGALHHHHNIAPANRRPAGAGRRARRSGLLINCGLFLISTAGSFIVFHTAGDTSAIDDPAFALVAFMFILLGVWFALLALIADQFPGAARAAVVIARALKGYLLGGGN